MPLPTAVRQVVRLTAFLSILLLSSNAFAQPAYVGRWDAFAGYAYLNSPKISLPEHGGQAQIGYRWKKWVSIGFDFTAVSGSLTLTPDLLPTDLQARLGAQLAQLAAAGKLPPGYALVVPSDSKTQTFALGPQVAYRHWKAVTLFARPGWGAIHEIATPRPKDPIATAIVKQLAPSGKKQDWTPFIGVGGGVDLNFSKYWSFRIQADLVRDHLFDDLLKDARNTLRFSIGPAFQWGKNIMQ